MTIWFSSDLHLGHQNILKYCPDSRGQYSSIDEMNEDIIKKNNEKVKPGDDVYNLGDLTWYRDPVKLKALLQRMNGNHHLILGNHDDKELIKSLDFFKTIRAYHRINIKKKAALVLFHFPIEYWDKQHHGSIHLHGHMHATISKADANLPILRFDAGVDCWKMAPVSLEEILAAVDKKKERLGPDPFKKGGNDN